MLLYKIFYAHQMLAVVVAKHSRLQFVHPIKNVNHVLEDSLYDHAELESNASGHQQFQQQIPKLEHIVFALVDALNVVVILSFQILSNCNDRLDAFLVGVYVGFDGFVLFGGRLNGRQVGAEVVLRYEPLVFGQPSFAHAGFAIEASGKLFQLFLADQLFLKSQLALVFGLFQIFPRFVYVADQPAFARQIRFLIVGAHTRLKRKQQHFQIALRYKLRRFLLGSIGVEFGQLLLYASQTVYKLSIIQALNSLLYPLQKIGRQSLVLFNHQVIFHQFGNNFANASSLYGLVAQLVEVVIVADQIRDDGLFVGHFHVHIFGVQQGSNAQLGFRHIERVFQVGHRVRLLQFVKGDNVGSMLVNKSIECKTVSPTCGEISNVDIRISGRLHLTPKKQCFPG
ncbi:hypothetical protein M514_22401, partial [Trichuris suis]